MKRLFLVFLVLACLVTVGTAQEKRSINTQSVGNTDLLRQLLTNRFTLVEDDIAELQALQSLGKGTIHYVCSVNGADTYTGHDKDHPFATLDKAIDAAT